MKAKTKSNCITYSILQRNQTSDIEKETVDIGAQLFNLQETVTRNQVSYPMQLSKNTSFLSVL